MSDVDKTIDKLKSEGQVDSEGHFTADWDRAKFFDIENVELSEEGLQHFANIHADKFRKQREKKERAELDKDRKRWRREDKKKRRAAEKAERKQKRHQNRVQKFKQRILSLLKEQVNRGKDHFVVRFFLAKIFKSRHEALDEVVNDLILMGLDINLKGTFGTSLTVRFNPEEYLNNNKKRARDRKIKAAEEAILNVVRDADLPWPNKMKKVAGLLGFDQCWYWDREGARRSGKDRKDRWLRERKSRQLFFLGSYHDPDRPSDERNWGSVAAEVAEIISSAAGR